MRLRKDAKIELIRRVPLFARCSKQELAEVAKIADEIDLPAGKTLMRQGQRGSEFFVLVEGTAEVEKDGKRIRELDQGDFFGEIALVTRSPRTATVTTSSPVRALVITDRSFRSLLDRSPSVMIKVMEALAERLVPATL
jgi:CRP/FNR family cyclic AMP-dependent transcriptional regulator